MTKNPFENKVRQFSPEELTPLETDASQSEILPFDPENSDLYLNRELSLMKFNVRVLEQALNEDHPLLERLKFLLIFSSNVDELFEIRVAGLKKRLDENNIRIRHDGMHPKDIQREVITECQKQVQRQYEILNEILIPAMKTENIHFLKRNEWNEAQAAWLKNYFHREIQPVVSPIGLDPAHPFPRLVNKSLNFIVSLKGKDAFGRDSGLAVIPAPRSLPRLLKLPEELCDGSDSFVFLSSVIHAYAEELFHGMKVIGCYQFRITRNADLELHEEDFESIADALQGELPARRFGKAVRLEVSDRCPEELIEYLRKETGLAQDEVFNVQGPVNLARLFALPGMVNRPDLLYPSFKPKTPKAFRGKSDLFEAIRNEEVLLYHPYQSFTPVIELVQQAAKDPNVLAIKQTLYRSGDKSKLVDALIEAARNKKEVTVVIELRARFDEEENLIFARQLQEAGALVVYGVLGYKTHAKMLMIVRREQDQLRRYLHLGTGNYHPGNARLYTDYGLMTCDDDLGSDVHKVFQQLTGMGKALSIKKIFNAPFSLKSSLLDLIEQERQHALEGKEAYIIAKANGLTEPKVIQALYRASQAGVKVDLIIRGMCCLRPNIPGLSENIKVRSIVGRFLEHSRVYYFKNNKQNVFCSSADLMERNLDNRVELCFPVCSEKLSARILKELQWALEDNSQSWELQNDGSYILNTPDEGEEKISYQQTLLEKLTK